MLETVSNINGQKKLHDYRSIEVSHHDILRNQIEEYSYHVEALKEYPRISVSALVIFIKSSRSIFLFKQTTFTGLGRLLIDQTMKSLAISRRNRSDAGVPNL